MTDKGPNLRAEFYLISKFFFWKFKNILVNAFQGDTLPCYKQMGLTDDEIDVYKQKGQYDESYDRITGFMRHGLYGRVNSTTSDLMYLKAQIHDEL